MSRTIEGFVSRVFVGKVDQNWIMHIMIRGSDELFSGTLEGAKSDSISDPVILEGKLTREGDAVKFRYVEDFNNYICDFMNASIPETIKNLRLK